MKETNNGYQGIMTMDASIKKVIAGSEILKVIQSTKNVKVKFVKKSDGKDRVMNCTLDFGRIPKEFHPKGEKKTVAKAGKISPYLPVFDLENKGWRSIPLYNLDWINIDGEEYLIEYDEKN